MPLRAAKMKTRREDIKNNENSQQFRSVEFDIEQYSLSADEINQISLRKENAVARKKKNWTEKLKNEILKAFRELTNL